VRFGQNLGYTGFKQLQGVFQTRLATAAPDFRERISALESELSRNVRQGNKGFLQDLVVCDIAALQGLLDSVTDEMLCIAARPLTSACTIYIAGQLSPLAKEARVLFTVPEDEYTFSRSLVAPMCLVQSIATAALLQPNKDAAPRIPSVTEISKDQRARLPRPIKPARRR
jgi:DNA-binding MurR/RpiR family transcriptional regulator